MPRRFPRISPEWTFGMCVALLYGVRVGQPIVDNYVGRQVPTAMVARNLERGSGFLRPQLDTAPFPNFFLVEPPVFAQAAVLLRKLTSVPLDGCGRLISAIGMVLLCWGTSGLVRRRQDGPLDPFVYFLAAMLPVCLRFGAAFQPDVFALGLVLAGFRFWDDHEADGRPWRLVAAWCLVAMGLATKVSFAFALVPLIVAILRPRTPRKVALALSTLAPAALWYAYAAWMLGRGGGSRASADNASHWLAAVAMTAWTNPETYRTVARMLFWRAFGPFVLPLALIGLVRPWKEGRFWRLWFASAAIFLVLVGGKLHHEYYFLALAPAVAVGIGRAIDLPRHIASRRAASSDESNRAMLANRRRAGVAALASAAMALPLFVSFARVQHQTRKTPPEWASWPQAVSAIREHAPPGAWIVAPEAILYLADRRGCRLEYEPKARLRAAGEWGATIDPDDPLALVEFYRSKGAKFVCDLWPVADEPDRRALHDAIRRRYNVLIDRDGVILAALVDRE